MVDISAIVQPPIIYEPGDPGPPGPPGQKVGFNSNCLISQKI